MWQSHRSPAPEPAAGSALVTADLVAAGRWLGAALATLRSPVPVSGLIGRESQTSVPHGGGDGSVTRVVHLRYALADGAAIQVSTAWDSGGDAPIGPLLRDLLLNREYELVAQSPDGGVSPATGDREKPASTMPVTVDGDQVAFVNLHGSTVHGSRLVALGRREGERRIAIVVPATHLHGIDLLSQPG